MIETARDGDLLQLTLNRPEKANSLTAQMLEDLIEQIREFDGKALVLTGSGKVFSAGADLDAAKAGLATSPLWEDLSGAIARFDGISTAALNGTLAGGACGMALACDLRIAVPTAKVVYPVMKLGFLPQPSDPARLVALVGPARAKMILLAGAKVEAQDALSWGLFDQIVAPDVLLETARSLAADSLGATASHVAAIKQMIRG